MTSRQYRRCSVRAQSTWKKSVASVVAAWVCRNCRQVVSVCCFGAGGIFSALRTRRIVEALTRWPGLSSSPWVRWYPRPWFSRASRPVSTAISGRTGGRPVRFGQARFGAIRRRCQRSTVPGVTSRCVRRRRGRIRISAARTARSARSTRGRGRVRRSTATSCRSTSSSMSLGCRRAAQQGQPAAEPDENQVKQAGRHG
jgi:hypothetical protein